MLGWDPRQRIRPPVRPVMRAGAGSEQRERGAAGPVDARLHQSHLRQPRQRVQHVAVPIPPLVLAMPLPQPPKQFSSPKGGPGTPGAGKNKGANPANPQGTNVAGNPNSPCLISFPSASVPL